MTWLVVFIALNTTPPQIQVIAQTPSLETCLTMVKAHMKELNERKERVRGYFRCLDVRGK